MDGPQADGDDGGPSVNASDATYAADDAVPEDGGEGSVDAARADASVEAGPVCLSGGACAVSACTLGSISCNAGAMQCANAQPLTNGTACDAGADAYAVCAAGTCGVCSPGADCTKANSCQKANVVCTSGSSVCTPAGNVADGTPCGTNLYCNGGNCQACTPGTSCVPSGKPCDQGTVTCSQGQVVCTDKALPVTNGTSCGTNQVCAAGACVSCTANVACTPAAACHKGLTSCSTGASVCVDQGAAQNGTSCTATDGCQQTFTCSSGTCTGSNPVVCSAIDNCHLPGTCTSTGATTHTCSTPIAGNGASCATNEVCSAGACVSCTANVACTPAAVCHKTLTSCSTGASVCVDQGAAPDGTSCTGTDACYQTFACSSGTCTGSSPVVCSAIDNCHLPGTCGPTTHACSNPNAGNGTSCGTNMICTNGSCGCAAGTAMQCGGCVSLQTDDKNCGSCGHHCNGAGCSAGTCNTVALGTFPATPIDFTIDSSYVYTAASNGDVRKCSLSGCSGGTSLITNVPNLLSVFANSSGVFWSGGVALGMGGAIGGCSPASCTNGIMNRPFTNEAGRQITADSAHIYFILAANGNGSFNGIQSCPLAGCPGTDDNGPTAVESVGNPYVSIAVNGGFVYYSDAYTLLKCSTGGCGTSPTNLWTASVQTGFALSSVLADASNVYWVDGNTNGSVYQCPIGGCPTNPPPSALGTGASAIAIDSNYVYWATTNSVVKCAIGGCSGNPTTVIANITINSNIPIARVDSTSVYWFDGMTLMKVAK